MYPSDGAATRRNLLRLLAGLPWVRAPIHLAAQGVATRGARPTPRGKPSGIPFLARFTDVAQAAGLHAPTIYGGIDHKDYIVETMGCGCAFFFFLLRRQFCSHSSACGGFHARNFVEKCGAK